MKRTFFFAFSLIVLLSGCGAPKVLTSMKTEAEKAEAAGNYAVALSNWKSYIETTEVEQIPGEDFAKAAKAAFQAGNSELAKSWFDQARYKSFADAEMYLTLAKIYENEGNISKELGALEYFSEHFGNENSEVNERLFQIYAEIGESGKALAAWNSMNGVSRDSEKNQLDFLAVNKKMENNEVCDSVAAVMLKTNPDQFEALDWLARKYYREGQDRYERSMGAYEANKTRKQYSKLLRELDLVTADFKRALPYLEKLWKQKPGKEYAAYFANIYARFGDEKKVDFYKKYLGN